MPRWWPESCIPHSLMCSLRSSSTPESLEMTLLGKALILFLGVGKPLYFFFSFVSLFARTKALDFNSASVVTSLCLPFSPLLAYFPKSFHALLVSFDQLLYLKIRLDFFRYEDKMTYVYTNDHLWGLRVLVKSTLHSYLSSNSVKLLPKYWVYMWFNGECNNGHMDWWSCRLNLLEFHYLYGHQFQCEKKIPYAHYKSLTTAAICSSEKLSWKGTVKIGLVIGWSWNSGVMKNCK